MKHDYLRDIFDALPRGYRKPVRVGMQNQVRFNAVVRHYKDEYTQAAVSSAEGSTLPCCTVVTRVALPLVAFVDDDPSLISLKGDEPRMAPLDDPSCYY